MRAQKHLVLPDEDAAEFAGLEAALVEELAPVGALQAVLARRVAVAAWRLARADKIEAELFEERRSASGGLGLALIRDGNGARSFETLLRYRGAAMAEFWRALRTLKALQAEQAATELRRQCRPAPPLRPARGHGSPIARNRTNPSAAPPPPIPAERAARVRRAARACRPLAAERTRERRRSAHAHLTQLPISTEPEAALSSRPAPYPRLSRRS